MKMGVALLLGFSNKLSVGWRGNRSGGSEKVIGTGVLGHASC